MRRLRMALPWIWACGAGIAALILALRSLEEDFDALAVGVATVIAVLAALGGTITRRVPGNRVAWILYAISFGLLMTIAINPYLLSVPESPTFLTIYAIVVIFEGGLLGVILSTLLLLFVFPDGRFLSRRWAWLAGVVVSLVPLSFALFAFTEEISWCFGRGQADCVEVQASNAYGFIPTDVADGVFQLAQLGVLVLVVGGVSAMVVRYRRSSVVVRAQVKWVLLACLVSAAAIAAIMVGNISGNPEESGFLFVTPPILIASAVTVAITRFRLFEIDRIISRTVSYALIVALLGAVFAAGTIWLPSALRIEDNALLVAASTLAVAALFNPLRKRVHRAVDRRFNRTSYAAGQVTDEFSQRLHQAQSADQIAQAWVETVDSYFEPKGSGVWIKEST